MRKMVRLVELMGKQKKIILMKIPNYVKELGKRIKGFRIIKEMIVMVKKMDRV